MQGQQLDGEGSDRDGHHQRSLGATPAEAQTGRAENPHLPLEQPDHRQPLQSNALAVLPGEPLQLLLVGLREVGRHSQARAAHLLLHVPHPERTGSLHQGAGHQHQRRVGIGQDLDEQAGAEGHQLLQQRGSQDVQHLHLQDGEDDPAVRPHPVGLR